MRARRFAVIAALLVVAADAGGAKAATARFSVGYTSEPALTAALAEVHGVVVRRVPALRIAEIRLHGNPLRSAARVACRPGILSIAPVAARASRAEPALTAQLVNGLPLEWQYGATYADVVPASIQRAARSLTIAVVDTGADVSAPDLAGKAPAGYNVHAGNLDVRDPNGHGTFVASLAGGSPSNREGIAGFGGDARLLIVKADGGNGAFSDVDEAIGIVYAVDHGAQIINLSLGGPTSSEAERNAIAYAARHDVLLVAAAGNDAQNGNPVEYPAALLQPDGPSPADRIGLAVGASTMLGRRAPFSSFGSYLSLVAPGVDVLGDLSSTASSAVFQPVRIPGSRRGRYGIASGTSFAAPQVAGAAALVWAANPTLSSADVATILEETASGNGAWTPELGYGVLDVAAAVARASGRPLVSVDGVRTADGVRLSWRGHGVSRFRLSARKDGGPTRVLVAATSTTSTFVRLTGGHRYSFTVTGLGTPSVSSQPFTVSTLRSDAAVGVASSLAGSRLLTLTASLRAALPSVPLASRPLVLEAKEGTRWRIVARATTDMAGQAQWTVRLAGRSYTMRVLFPGADDLEAASSAVASQG